jgi:hypothetical protein
MMRHKTPTEQTANIKTSQISLAKQPHAKPQTQTDSQNEPRQKLRPYNFGMIVQTTRAAVRMNQHQ